MSSFRSDFDDIAVGPQFVIFAQGRRRVLFDKLSTDQVDALSKLSPGTVGPLSTFGDLSGQLFARGLLVGHEGGLLRRERRAGFSARQTGRLARPFRSWTSTPGLILICLFFFGSLPLLGLAAGVLAEAVRPTLDSIAAMLIQGLIFTYATMLFHELGHAASCLRLTGAVGGIRLGWHKGMLLMAVDVSSVVHLPARQRWPVAVSGPIFQLGAAAAILWLGYANLIEARLALLAFGVSTMAAAYSLVPNGRNDGSSMLRYLRDRNVAVTSMDRFLRVGLHAVATCAGSALIFIILGGAK